MKEKRISFWWPLAQNLIEYLNSRTDENGKPLFGGVKIYAGTYDKARTYPSIEILWDNESGISVNNPYQGTVKLWVDTHVKSNEKDPAPAYAKQDELQTKIFSVLWDWTPYARDTIKIGPSITIDELFSDGDIYHPVHHARIILNIDWHQVRGG